MNARTTVGIASTGIYLPAGRMTAKEIAEATGGHWTKEAVETKLGIYEKIVPGEEDGTQEMGVCAALDALKNGGVDAKELDVILCIGEEWKEYPLTTSSIYIQEQIGATNAWGIDVQQRCCTCVAAMKIAKDMMIADEEVKTVMIVGGYRNGDLVDYSDPVSSMLYNLSAGGGALILKRNHPYNEVLGTHLLTDGSMARDAGVEVGGTANPINQDNLQEAYQSLKLMRPDHMKERLNEVSMKNWFNCIDRAFEKSGLSKEELSYLAVLHFKPSMHAYMLKTLGLTEAHTTYLSRYGHMGQIDQILSLHIGRREEKIQEGTVVAMIAAGIGYAWAANVIRWGPVKEREES
ncbi:3-oxoacyl-ACP synthase [Shouchella shacheensis]|uniref:3-oxoacyl-ACP synthase n=1 Tax=Shouchella shacheensis TaxID=1649580 RepID=UPI00073FADE2|nr:3-oxoacyl-ACP synthase [Shouchella shacheensis]